MSVIITKELVDREEVVSKYIEKYATMSDLDPNLVRALITQESRFMANASSPTNAFGYGQFTNIGARQVQEVARVHSPALFGVLASFQKKEASDPDRGIYAICAFLWWLLHVKYKDVADKQTRLEAALTFYNAGGRAAALIVKYGGFANARIYLDALPSKYRSQAPDYAGETSRWYVAWHEEIKRRESKTLEDNTRGINPFDPFAVSDPGLSVNHQALVEVLRLLDGVAGVNVIVDSRDGLTEVTLVLPGEYFLAHN